MRLRALCAAMELSLSIARNGFESYGPSETIAPIATLSLSLYSLEHKWRASSTSVVAISNERQLIPIASKRIRSAKVGTEVKLSGTNERASER